MKKQTLNEIIELTQECLTRFWKLDVDFAMSYFDKDILWIGSAQSQFTVGYDETAADFRGIVKELVPCHLLNQEFYVLQNYQNTCTISGRYLTTTDDEVGYFMQVQQRCTFTWEIVKGSPKIKHIHISNPMGELALAKGERIPNTLGKMSKRYWQHTLSAAQDKSRIIVVDRSKVTHFLIRSEIVFAAADRKNSVIHTLSGGLIHAKMSITDFLNAAGSGFSSVHRSYVVNNRYISRIEPYIIVMADGTKIPVPVKKYTELRDVLVSQYDIIVGEKDKKEKK